MGALDWPGNTLQMTRCSFVAAFRGLYDLRCQRRKSGLVVGAEGSGQWERIILSTFLSMVSVLHSGSFSQGPGVGSPVC